MSEIPHVWTCPSCGRRVPTRVPDCRCGHRQADAPPPLPQPSAPRPAAAGTPWSLIAIGLLVAGGAVLAMVPRLSTPADSAAAAITPVTDAIAPRGDATEGATEGATTAFVPPVVVREGAFKPAAPPAAEPAPGAAASLEDVVSRVVPAVVSITAGSSRGTGFYIRPDHVLTNVHVVNGQSSVEVFSGGAKRTARVMRTAPGADLAVLQVYGPDPQQPTLTLGTAQGVRVGQEVIAVGSALGVLSNTVTRGIVSAMRATADVTLIQTDAAINPGNSGGPLVDRAGRVIGINTLKIGRGAESIGFAVAIDHARDLLSGQARAAAPAPIAGLNTMLRSGGPSEGEQQRQQGEQQYTAVMQWAARGADQIDGLWTRYARACVANARRSGDREWFAVYEPNGVTISAHSEYDCQQFLATVARNAQQIKGEVDKATESARRAGVYPGVLRDLRRRHRMDWQGWDR